MEHFYFDGIKGFRSRLDDLRLVYEYLEELPEVLGLTPVMPPFILPYYNGVQPDDCGISSFMFIRGGHVTLHTFSFREALFLDLMTVEPLDADELVASLERTFPCRTSTHGVVKRGEPWPADPPEPGADDFGPHLFLDLEDYSGPATLDALFELLDGLPATVGMPPIIRPFVLPGRLADGQRVVSALTMIAESHVSLHVLPDQKRAYFDLFSCSFFDPGTVLPELRRMLPGDVVSERLAVRGVDFKRLRTDRDQAISRGRAWLPSRSR